MKPLLPFIALLLLMSCSLKPVNPNDSEQAIVCKYHRQCIPV